MGWHRPELTEAEVLQAVVDGVGALVPCTVGAAVLSRPTARSGNVRVLGASGTPTGLDRLSRHGAARPGVLPAGPLLGGGRERDGWAVATTPAPGGSGTLIWAPLGHGRTCHLLLIAAAAGAVPDRVEADAVVLAMHAATAVAAARQREHFQIAVNTRDVIGQAKGIVMQRLQLTADAAFDLLARASQDTNVKLHHLCAGVCATGDLRGLERQS